MRSQVYKLLSVVTITFKQGCRTERNRAFCFVKATTQLLLLRSRGFCGDFRAFVTSRCSVVQSHAGSTRREAEIAGPNAKKRGNSSKS